MCPFLCCMTFFMVSSFFDCVLWWGAPNGGAHTTFPWEKKRKNKVTAHSWICIRSPTLLPSCKWASTMNLLNVSTWRTPTSSLFPTLKFIVKRHCFFKIALAVIGSSVHCLDGRGWSGGVDWYTGGRRHRGAYHQRTSCGAKARVLNASSRHG